MGCSVTALERIAKIKGYVLVSITETNCFFVKQEEFSYFAEYETELSKICINQFVRYLITDFAGNYSLITGKDFVQPFGINSPSTQKINGEFLQLPPIK